MMRCPLLQEETPLQFNLAQNDEESDVRCIHWLRLHRKMAAAARSENGQASIYLYMYINMQENKHLKVNLSSNITLYMKWKTRKTMPKLRFPSMFHIDRISFIRRVVQRKTSYVCIVQTRTGVHKQLEAWFPWDQFLAQKRWLSL